MSPRPAPPNPRGSPFGARVGTFSLIQFSYWQIQVGIRSYGPATYGNCDRHKNKIFNMKPSRRHRTHTTLSRSYGRLLCIRAEVIMITRIVLLTADISQGFVMCDCSRMMCDARDLASQLKTPYMQHQLWNVTQSTLIIISSH